jgi:hypothetical protein
MPVRLAEAAAAANAYLRSALGDQLVQPIEEQSRVANRVAAFLCGWEIGVVSHAITNPKQSLNAFP